MPLNVRKQSVLFWLGYALGQLNFAVQAGAWMGLYWQSRVSLLHWVSLSAGLPCPHFN
jgi:hypothetical protein